jgi:hypothetical protein
MGLLERRAGLDIKPDRVVTAPGVQEVIPVDPAGVAEQVPKCHARAHVRVGHRELRQIGPHRDVNVRQPFIDELHEDRSSPGLARRTNLEHGVRGYLDPGVQVDHPGRGLDDLAVVQDADRRPGRLMLGDQGAEPCPELGRIKKGHGLIIVASPRSDGVTGVPTAIWVSLPGALLRYRRPAIMAGWGTGEKARGSPAPPR